MKIYPKFIVLFLFAIALSNSAIGQAVNPGSLQRVQSAPVANSQNYANKNAPVSNGLVYGKYNCTASQYNGGEVTYIARGSFVISKDGKYTYYGFKNPSKGTFTVDKSGNLLFKGGYFNGGKAEKIDRPNKFFLVFPANPDNRWTCALAGK